jgi:hypothetical protein
MTILFVHSRQAGHVLFLGTGTLWQTRGFAGDCLLRSAYNSFSSARSASVLVRINLKQASQHRLTVE